MTDDTKIYLTREELALASGRKVDEISDKEYDKYIEWTSQRW